MRCLRSWTCELWGQAWVPLAEYSQESGSAGGSSQRAWPRRGERGRKEGDDDDELSSPLPVTSAR